MFGFKREQAPQVLELQEYSPERAYELTHDDASIRTLVDRWHMLQMGGPVMNDRALLDETERALIEQLRQRGVALMPTESTAGFDDTIGSFVRQFYTSNGE